MQRRNFLRGLLLAPLAGLFPTFTWAEVWSKFTNWVPVRSLSKTEQQSEMLGKLLKTAGGRQLLAASIGPSIRRRRDYTSLIRKAFHTQNDPVIRNVTEQDLYVVGEEGGDIIRVSNPKIINFPTFRIVSNPMIPYSDVTGKRFDLVARCLNLSKAEIGACEEGYMFALMNAAAEGANAGGAGNPDLQYEESLEFLEPMKAQFAKQGVKEINFAFVHPRDFVTLLKNQTFMNHFDRETKRSFLKAGVMGYYQLADKGAVTFIQNRKVTYGYIYITGNTPATETEPAVHTGYVVDHVPLTVQSTDRLDLEQIGFTISEKVGFALNPIAVQRVKIATDKPVVEPVDEGDDLDKIIDKTGIYPWAEVKA